MRITKVKIENFYSISSIELDLNLYGGINLIMGDNKDTGGSNASGKSSIVDAITWGLFGSTVRKSTAESLVNHISKKPCSVEITINDGETVIWRQKSPPKLKVMHKGIDETKDAMAATQANLVSLLNISEESFLASIVFGQHSSNEFLDLTPESKRKIIASIFDLKDIFKYMEVARKLKSKYRNQVEHHNVILKEYDEIKKNVKGAKKFFNKKINVLNEEKIKDCTKLEVMKFWEKAFSENGIIKLVIKSVLPKFNEKCNYYLGILTDNGYSISFDESFDETIINPLGNSVKHISLSGGERRRINLAVMLGLLEMLNKSGNNLPEVLFLDEVAENFDQKSVNHLVKLLEELKKTKQIFIITHNKYLLDKLSNFPKITLVKDKGITTLKGITI